MKSKTNKMFQGWIYNIHNKIKNNLNSVMIHPAIVMIHPVIVMILILQPNNRLLVEEKVARA